MSAGRGKLIAFEGLDGSGKSTQLGLLADRLRDLGIRVHETREPTDGPIGSLIHQMLTGRIGNGQETMAALFVADRLDHILSPADGMLARTCAGVHVLCDRYYFSSYAYQGAHLPTDWVMDCNALCSRILRPDVNLFLDLAPEKCLSRLEKERLHLELYENMESLTRVREKYLEAFELLGSEEEVLLFDADRDLDELSEEIWSKLEDMLSPHPGRT